MLRGSIVTLAILSIIAVITALDIAHDLIEGISSRHVFVEGMVAVSALIGAFISLGQVRDLSLENESLRQDVQKIRESEARWRAESQRHIQGLAQAIDDQFSRWSLSPAERDVALLLLKGMSLKDIASIRSTSERTVRQQSLAVYQKSGLGGRAELSAFFLEDLLVPIRIGS